MASRSPPPSRVSSPTSPAATLARAWRAIRGKLATSVVGTFRTWRDVRLESAFGGRADVICSERVFPVLTHNGRRAVSYVRLSHLREFPPCPLCGPPYEPAPADNEHAQRNPSINPCGND